MAEENTITQDKFDLLLRWLAIDGESGAEKYEAIRQRLIRVFIGRGCHEAETLADLTIDRVTLKVPELNENYDGDPAAYFHAVANNIHFEWLRQEKRARENMPLDSVHDDTDEREAEFRCLESCLTKLTENVREMIIEYYRDEKRAKIERRQRLATRLGITTGALQVKTNRVRATLLVCVRRCLGENLV